MDTINPEILENFQEYTQKMKILHRLNKEYKYLSTIYTVNIIKNGFIIDIPIEIDAISIDIKLKVLIPEATSLNNYPFSSPKFIVVEPFFYTIPNTKSFWGATKTIGGFNLQSKNISIIDTIIKPQLIELFGLINTTKSSIPTISDPAYLVLGSSPTEPNRGRDFYSNPSIYLLDEDDINNVDGNFPNYFKVDFTDSKQLLVLSQSLPKKFDEICFDYSTVKFFKIPQETVVERILSLKTMLKDNGTLYFEGIGSPPGGAHSVNRATGGVIHEDYTGMFIEQCQEAGLLTDLQNAEDIHSILIKEVFLKNTYEGIHTNPKILISKKILSGGRKVQRRKIHKTNKKNNYKLSKKRRNYKIYK